MIIFTGEITTTGEMYGRRTEEQKVRETPFRMSGQGGRPLSLQNDFLQSAYATSQGLDPFDVLGTTGTHYQKLLNWTLLKQLEAKFKGSAERNTSTLAISFVLIFYSVGVAK